jgi:hypothetical protein
MVSVVGNTLRALAVAIAQDVGPYQEVPLLSTGASGTVFTCATLADSEAPTQRYGGYYLYSHGPSVLAEQNRITRGGFTTAGVVTVAKQFSATPQSGTTMSLLGTIPWTDQDGLTGLRTCINSMAQRLWIRYRYPIVSTGGAVVTYDLGALWWASRQRFIRLLEPDYSSTGKNAPASVDWNIVQNGDIWTLELGAGYATGETFYLVCEMPLNGRIYSAGSSTWSMTATPTAGILADGDAYLGEWNTVFQCAKHEVMKQLAVQAGGNRKAYWQGEAEKQGVVVSAIKTYMMNDDGQSLGEGPSQAASSGVGSIGDRGLFSGGRNYY